MGNGPSTVGKKHTGVVVRAELRASVVAVIRGGRSLSRPQLTAGEVSRGGIRKPPCLGRAIAAVHAYRQSRLDALFAA
jgi:hypothetical protein